MNQFPNGLIFNIYSNEVPIEQKSLCRCRHSGILIIGR